MKLMDAYMKAAAGDFGTEDQEESDQTDAAKEAVSSEMAMAMMKYMPLRGSLSFGDPAQAEEKAKALDELLKQLNAL